MLLRLNFFALDVGETYALNYVKFQDDFWNKSEALDNLIKMLKQPNTRETLEPGPAGLLFEALFACQNLDKLHFLADVSMLNNLVEFLYNSKC